MLDEVALRNVLERILSHLTGPALDICWSAVTEAYESRVGRYGQTAKHLLTADRSFHFSKRACVLWLQIKATMAEAQPPEKAV